MLRHLTRLKEIAPLGCSIGLHIRFAKPFYAMSTLPRAWQDAYAEQGYALRDPTIFWGISKSGATRWSEIALPDPFGVMKKALEYGVAYGATISCGKITSRTLIGVAAGTREFDDAEIEEVVGIAQDLHEAAAPAADLTPAMIEVLRLLRHGARPPDAAAKIGISEEAFRGRLSATQRALGTASLDDTMALARNFGVI